MSALGNGDLFGFAADLCMGHLMRGASSRASSLSSLHSQLSAAEDKHLNPPDPSLDVCPKCDDGIISKRIGPGEYLHSTCETCNGTGKVDGYEMTHPCNCGDRCVC